MGNHLRPAERKRIWTVQRTAKLSGSHPDMAQRRLIHVAQVIKNFKILKEGTIKDFYSQLTEKNRKLENESDYLYNLDGLRNLYHKLPQPVISRNTIRAIFGRDTSWECLFENATDKILVFKSDAAKIIHKKFKEPILSEKLLQLLEQAQNQTIEKPAFEAGVMLHDIGYAKSAGADHSEKGYEMLNDPAIQDTLALTSTNDFDTISMMARYHGFFSDIGYLYPPKEAFKLPLSHQICLAVMNALDSTARPFGKNAFHSMLFSRVLKRLNRFVSDGNFTIPPEDRLRQLFGPLNYVWLDENDKNKLVESLELSGLIGKYGFHLLLEKAYFHCWGLVKDIITPQISFAEDYYTEIKDEYIPHLTCFLAVVSNILKELDPQRDVIVDTDPRLNYNNFANRDPYLNYLRNDLSIISAKSLIGAAIKVSDKIKTTSGGYKFGRQLFRISNTENNIKITIGPIDFAHYNAFTKAISNHTP